MTQDLGMGGQAIEPRRFRQPVLLVGGGVVEAGLLAEIRALCPHVAAADGGADQLLSHGIVPDMVVGDLDSLSTKARRALGPERLVRISEQNSTDFDKSLRMIDAPLILGVGFSGGRADHHLAALHGLVRAGSRAVVLVDGADLIMHLPNALELELEPGCRVSLFPLDAVTVAIEGLEWSFEKLELHPARRIGTSNRALGGRVRIAPSGAGLLLILPRDALGALLVALGSL